MAEAMQVNKRTRGGVERAQVEKKDQFLAFVLGGENFAMDIRSIKEVIQYGALTEVPLMPDFIRGVINLRGAVVPVIDLSVRFGRPATEVARRTCVVILEVEQEGDIVELGVIVDHVSEVLEIGASDIEPAPSFGSTLRSDFLAGVGKVGGKFVILLDVNHVLSIDEMAALASGGSRTEAS
ncbi:chemotaxis protein CheW [Geothrix sp. 21YS21S-2]|uniref:chemotaxis protein CheW n=1 Tax=Geothrix sp. 21YS21S-2 TaxID=3068893 RepID=UPI0027B90EAB|nr:chemotaxis protein CheW [Geothrix sp. 21YS21S-2]